MIYDRYTYNEETGEHTTKLHLSRVRTHPPTHTRARARTHTLTYMHAHTHASTHARTHAHTHRGKSLGVMQE